MVSCWFASAVHGLGNWLLIWGQSPCTQHGVMRGAPWRSHRVGSIPYLTECPPFVPPQKRGAL